MLSEKNTNIFYVFHATCEVYDRVLLDSNAKKRFVSCLHVSAFVGRMIHIMQSDVLSEVAFFLKKKKKEKIIFPYISKQTSVQ